MKTEKEKMLAGEVYSAIDPQLIEELTEVKEIIHDYNLLRPSEKQKARESLRGLLGHIADDEILIIQPFYCDYGKQISVGKRFFANFNFTVLDEAPVTIGDDCFIGPNVSIYTACHSTDPVERNSRREWAEPVSIGNNVWIGGSVTILPGVTIGDNVTIGAGSVVTKDIPSNSIAVGNPCKVMTCQGFFIVIEGDYSSTAAWAAFIICHHIAEMLLAPSSTEVPDPAVLRQQSGASTLIYKL